MEKATILFKSQQEHFAVEHTQPANRLAQLVTRLQDNSVQVPPALPQGLCRGARLEPLEHVQRVPLAQSLATFGLDWPRCLAVSQELHAGHMVSIDLPSVDDGPLATVVLANLGVRLILDR